MPVTTLSTVTLYLVLVVSKSWCKWNLESGGREEMMEAYISVQIRLNIE